MRKSRKVRMWALALVLAMAIQLPVFAEKVKHDTTGAFTVSGLEDNVEVSAYQIITVNIDPVSDQPMNPMYEWDASVADWLREQKDFKAYVGEAGDDSVTEAFRDDQSQPTKYKEFLECLAAAIKKGSNAGGVVLTPKMQNSINGETEFTEMAMGEYLLTAQGTDSVKVYQPTTALLVPKYEDGSWVLNTQVGVEGSMKSAEPSITKDVTGKADDLSVGIGDTVDYKLNVLTPSYPAEATALHFEVGDKMMTGLALQEDSITVWDRNDQKIEAAKNFEIKTEAGLTVGEDTKTFRILFTENFVKKYGGQNIKITYRATVTSNAFEKNTLENTAYIVYNNDPYTEESLKELTDMKNVYTYGIWLKKVDAEGNPLSGAIFTLAKEGEDETPLNFSGSDGTYVYNPENGSTTLTVSNDGSLFLKGVDAGTYILKETRAPDGYVLPEGKLTITIEDKNVPKDKADGTIDDASQIQAEGTIKLKPIKDKAFSIEGNIISFQVENTRAEDAGFTLPATGGTGTMFFAITGIFLMGCAVLMMVLFIKRKKCSH